MEKLKFIGYHGTNIDCASSIINEGFRFSKNKNDWLGWGIYFFEEHIKHAINWCVKARGLRAYVVLGVIIEVNEEELLDLVNPVVYEKFDLAKKMLKKRLNTDLKHYKSKVIKDNYVLDFLSCKYNVKLVRQSFIIPPYEKMYKKGKIVPMYVQLCVKNTRCIRLETLKIEASEDE